MKLRLIAAMIALATAAPLAHAADWPNRPIHFIVPFPAGGSTDVAARLIGDYISRSLVQSGSARSPALPDVPTFQESGFKDLLIEQRVGVLMPKRTSAEIVARLNSEISAAVREEKLRKILADQAQDAAGGTPDQYSKLLQSDSDLVARLVKELNIELQ